MQPTAKSEALVYNLNGSPKQGRARIGADISMLFKVWKDASHSFVHTNHF